jgi:hypothetical protein
MQAYFAAATTGRDLTPVLAIRASAESAVLPEGSRRALRIGTAREAMATAAAGFAAWMSVFSRWGEALEFPEPVLDEDHFGHERGLSFVEFHHQEPPAVWGNAHLGLDRTQPPPAGQQP